MTKAQLLAVGSTAELEGGCPHCGCTGVHACIGRRLEPMSETEHASLSAVMQRIAASQEPLGEPFSSVLHENRWELYEGEDEPSNAELKGRSGEAA